jgi:tetratricopeptide (TPR) repeat protein
MFNKQMISDNGDAAGTWIDAYQTINIVNNVLDGIDIVNPTDRPVVEGEALFIRGLLYFELVRYYGLQYEPGQTNSQPAVPLILEPTRAINEGSFVSRNTVEEVYTQVLADLTRAASILPASNSWRANSGAANAILSRVYLQRGEFQNALNAASAVIESDEYALVDSYADAFNRDGNSSEDIFAIQNTTQDGTNSMNLFFSIPDFGGRDGDIDILDGHLDLYDPADERLALFYDGNGAMRSGKWNNQFGNIGVIRLAEMYLTRAECNLRLGSSVGAPPVDDYNTVHTRAGLPAADDVTLDDVLLERRLELAHEGFKIHDMRRNQISVPAATGDIPYNDDKLVFPIPLREINANPNLTQNPGY